MAEPIIIVRENGLVIEIDLQDEQCSPPQVIPAGGKHEKFTLRWTDANYKHGKFNAVEEDEMKNGEPTGRKQTRIFREKQGGSAGGSGGGGGLS